MRKHRTKRKQPVYHNNSKDTFSPDEREVYLSPESEERKRLEKLRLQKAFDDIEKEAEEEERRKDADTDRDEREKDLAHERKEDVFDPARDFNIHSYRRKLDKVKVAKRILDDAGIDAVVENNGSLPGIESMTEELHNPAITQDAFIKDVVRDYERDFKEICQEDNNNDGRVDDDDITPGMRKLMRYM